MCVCLRASFLPSEEKLILYDSGIHVLDNEKTISSCNMDTDPPLVVQHMKGHVAVNYYDVWISLCMSVQCLRCKMYFCIVSFTVQMSSCIRLCSWLCLILYLLSLSLSTSLCDLSFSVSVSSVFAFVWTSACVSGWDKCLSRVLVGGGWWVQQ